MRKNLIAGNWKMNGDSNSIKELVLAIDSQLNSDWESEILLCAPSIYLPLVINLTKDSSLKVGAQNLSHEAKGAFTGEISGSMLKDADCEYVLVGHSERRSIYGESSKIIAQKFQTALDNGLIPVLCIGETLEERENDTTMDVVKEQIDAVLALGIDVLAQGVIAYEPVWAIGTGKTASPDQAQAVHAGIRDHLAGHCGDVAQRTRILYGGSMNPSNAKELLAQTDIDGGLIGGASLKAEQFIEICKAAG